MTFPITIALSSLLALWLLVLSLNVSRARGDASVSLGDGGDEPLLRRIRAQANFVEYVPMVIVLFGIGEYLQTNVYFLGGLATLFFLGRLAHGLCLVIFQQQPTGPEVWCIHHIYRAFGIADQQSGGGILDLESGPVNLMPLF